MSAGKVRTVLGDVDPQTIGRTMMHEHLLIGFMRWRREAGTLEWRGNPDPRAGEPITLANRYWVSFYGRHPDEYRLDDEETAIAEAERFKSAGGATIVDVSNPDLTRQAEALQRISRTTGLHVVMGCGRYVGSNHPLDMDQRSVDELTQELIRDVTEGADGTDIRSGIIGEIGTEYPISKNEERSLVAATEAQRETGAAISIHPGRNPRAPMEVMQILTQAGCDASRCVMGHLDRTLFSSEDLLELATTSCYLEFDLFGQESSYYAHAPIDMPNDAMRINYIRDLIEAGYGDKIVISQDICQKSNLTSYGGHGYAHILENVVPVMLRKGMTEEDIDRILIENPARILTLVDPAETLTRHQLS
jgi:phosphotriesterase-related protein|tara:strand:+ start:10367 stop:11452 length:1086 start_codon:yes stop_codon:yes gene_type:complete